MGTPETAPDSPAVLAYGREKHSPLWRRSMWLFRIVRKIALWGFIILAVLHTAWLWWSTGQLDAAIQKLKDAGEPVTLADLNLSGPPSAELDAFNDVLTIIGRKTVVSDRATNLPGEPDLPLLKVERTRLQAYVDECREALPILERLQHQPVNLRLALKSPAMGTFYRLSELRGAAMFLVYAALLERDRGDDSRAMQLLGQTETVGGVARQSPGYIGVLIASGIRSAGTGAALRAASTLRIGNAPGEVTPSDVRKLISELANQQQVTKEFADALRTERVLVIDLMQAIDDGTAGGNFLGATGSTPLSPILPSIIRYIKRPYVRANAAGLLDQFDKHEKASQTVDIKTARAIIAQADKNRGPVMLNMLVYMIGLSYDRMLNFQHRIKVDRSLAAVALAVRLYRVERNEWPKSLESLVPDYLPSIPVDPFNSNKPLRAKFDGNKSFVWSAGEDGMDDNGDTTAVGKYPSDWTLRDRVEFLAGSPRVIEPKTQLLEDLDLDSPLSEKFDEKIVFPEMQTFANASTDAQPDVDDVVRFEVHGDVVSFTNMKSRRHAMASLARSFPVEVEQSRTPDKSKGVVAGTIDTSVGRWTFELYPDGSGIVTNAATNTGVQVTRDPDADEILRKEAEIGGNRMCIWNQ